MAKLFQMDAMETELRRLNAENRSLQDRGGVLLKLGGAGTPVFVFPTPITPTSETCILIFDKFHFDLFFETDESVS